MSKRFQISGHYEVTRNPPTIRTVLGEENEEEETEQCICRAEYLPKYLYIFLHGAKPVVFFSLLTCRCGKIRPISRKTKMWHFLRNPVTQCEFWAQFAFNRIYFRRLYENSKWLCLAFNWQSQPLNVFNLLIHFIILERLHLGLIMIFSWETLSKLTSNSNVLLIVTFPKLSVAVIIISHWTTVSELAVQYQIKKDKK